MKTQLAVAAYYVLSYISLVHASPVDLSNSDLIPRADKKETPDVDTIAADIRGHVGGDQSVFYTANTGGKATDFAHDHGWKVLQDTDTKAGYGRPNNWKTFESVLNNWSEAFAKDSSGTVWVMFTDLSPISPAKDSVWNIYEWPALIVNHNVYEVLQVSAKDTSKFVQIWPEDVRDRPRGCKWYGEAPICKGACPKGQKQITASHWGDAHHCLSGEKVFCCP